MNAHRPAFIATTVKSLPASALGGRIGMQTRIASDGIYMRQIPGSWMGPLPWASSWEALRTMDAVKRADSLTVRPVPARRSRKIKTRKARNRKG